MSEEILRIFDNQRKIQSDRLGERERVLRDVVASLKPITSDRLKVFLWPDETLTYPYLESGDEYSKPVIKQQKLYTKWPLRALTDGRVCRLYFWLSAPPGHIMNHGTLSDLFVPATIEFGKGTASTSVEITFQDSESITFSFARASEIGPHLTRQLKDYLHRDPETWLGGENLRRIGFEG